MSNASPTAGGELREIAAKASKGQQFGYDLAKRILAGDEDGHIFVWVALAALRSAEDASADLESLAS